MAASAKALALRKKVLKALKELKSTHSFEEISKIIGVSVYNIIRINKVYGEVIPLTPEAQKRLFGQTVNRVRHSNEIRMKVLNLRKNGFTFPQIAKELNIRERSATTIYYRLIKPTPKIKENKTSLADKLFAKYAKEKAFHLTPLFFIKNHGVTISTAKRICLKLQTLGVK